MFQVNWRGMINFIGSFKFLVQQCPCCESDRSQDRALEVMQGKGERVLPAVGFRLPLLARNGDGREHGAQTPFTTSGYDQRIRPLPLPTWVRGALEGCLSMVH